MPPPRIKIDKSMPKRIEKVFFGIYKESGCDKRYQIVYFSELDEHERDTALNRFIEGETIYTGFLKKTCLDEAKQLLADYLARWNAGTSPVLEELVSSISSCLHEP